MDEGRLRLLLRLGQGEPELEAVHAPRPAAQLVRRALGVHDPAAGGHPVHRSGLDALHAPEAVPVEHGPLEEEGDRGEPDVRVGAYVRLRVGLDLHRAEVIEEHEGTDPLPRHRGEEATHQETGAELLHVAGEAGPDRHALR